MKIQFVAMFNMTLIMVSRLLFSIYLRSGHIRQSTKLYRALK